LQKAWRAAEDLGVRLGHFYPLDGDPDGKHYQGMTSLTALAASTERASIRVLVETSGDIATISLLIDDTSELCGIPGGLRPRTGSVKRRGRVWRIPDWLAVPVRRMAAKPEAELREAAQHDSGEEPVSPLLPPEEHSRADCSSPR
jgi:hypothetical protein